MKNLASMIICLCTSMSANAIGISGQGTWETTLQGRDLDGNASTFEAYYDTVLDITWIADGNLAASYYPSYPTFHWWSANSFAANLDPYGSGISGWRLPAVEPVDGTKADDATHSYIGTEDRGVNISAPDTLYAGSIASEMAHLFYNTLGNFGYCNLSTSTATVCDIGLG